MDWWWWWEREGEEEGGGGGGREREEEEKEEKEEKKEKKKKKKKNEKKKKKKKKKKEEEEEGRRRRRRRRRRVVVLVLSVCTGDVSVDAAKRCTKFRRSCPCGHDPPRPCACNDDLSKSQLHIQRKQSCTSLLGGHFFALSAGLALTVFHTPLLAIAYVSGLSFFLCALLYSVIF